MVQRMIIGLVVVIGCLAIGLLLAAVFVMPGLSDGHRLAISVSGLILAIALGVIYSEIERLG